MLIQKPGYEEANKPIAFCIKFGLSLLFNLPDKYGLNSMTPKITQLSIKKLIGLNTIMSLANNKTAQLWKTFMPRRKEIENKLNSDLFSIQIYPAGYFDHFNPQNEFEKWAAVEVSDFDRIPVGMHGFTLSAGTYAVFNYK